MDSKQKYVEDLVLYMGTLGFHVSFEVSRFIACVSALETGYGTSELFKRHNLFGMRVPKSRICLNCGSYKGHCTYLSRFESVFDFFLWLQCMRFNKYDLVDLTSFIAKFKSSGFNPSDKYVSTVLDIYRKYYE